MTAIFVRVWKTLALVTLGAVTYPYALRFVAHFYTPLRGLFPATLSAEARTAYSVERLPDLSGRVTVVTGANVGLGYWTARHAVGRDATVILACRSSLKCERAASSIRASYSAEAAKEGTVVTLPLDLASARSILGFAKELKHRGFERIDALILNAGVMAAPYATTADGVELQIGVNHFGHALLAAEMLPFLRAGAAKRGAASITVLSSSAHFRPYPSVGIRASLEAMNDKATYHRWKAYGQSKLANVLFTRALAKRLARDAIRVNACHPGFVATSLMRHVEAPIISVASRAYFGTFAQWALSFIERSFAWTPDAAAVTQLFVAFDESIVDAKNGAGGGITGKYFHPVASETIPSAFARNEGLERSLWEITERWIAKMRRMHSDDHFKNVQVNISPRFRMSTQHI